MAATAANAQQDPHCPWSLTGVTLFATIQLTDCETLADEANVLIGREDDEPSSAGFLAAMRYVDANCVYDMLANLLAESQYVLVGSVLTDWIIAMLALKLANATDAACPTKV